MTTMPATPLLVDRVVAIRVLRDHGLTVTEDGDFVTVVGSMDDYALHEVTRSVTSSGATVTLLACSERRG